MKSRFYMVVFIFFIAIMANSGQHGRISSWLQEFVGTGSSEGA